MARRAYSASAHQALTAQVAADGERVCTKYGPHIGWRELQALLHDRGCVRFPCDLCFNAEPLLPGEFAHALPKGQKPEEGYTIYIHPRYEHQLQTVPYLVLHQL